MSPTASPPHTAPIEAPTSRHWALALLCVAQFMVILDVTVVNVALPVIGEELVLDRTALTWVFTAYTLCFGGLLLLGGRLADVLGRRRTFLTGLAVFTTASLVSGLADSGTVLVGARAAQGVGAALLSPAALSIITTMFHGPDRHRALGIWSAIGGVGGAVGVLLGGTLTSGPGWEWVFFINVPVGAAVALATPTLVGRFRPSGDAGRVDLPGALAATLGLGLLIYGLVEAGDAGWSAGATLLSLAAGGGLLAVFILVEHLTRAPLVPLALAVRRPVLAGNVVMLTAAGLLLSCFFLASQYLQHVLALSPFRTGLVFLPVAVAIAVGAHAGSRVLVRHGGRATAGGGFVLAAVGTLVLSRVPVDGQAVVDVLPGFAIAGLGLGVVFVTATTTALSRVDAQHAGIASGLVSTGHELGASLGVALVSTIAGSSLDVGRHGASVAGFADAFTGLAVMATLALAAALWLIPAGTPVSADGPVFAH